MCKLRRMAGLLAVVVAALALPASASAGGSHLLKLYKVEKHVDLEGDDAYDVSCNGSDYAVDGMWRVDQVDQDNDIPGNILTQVQVYESFATSKSTYHFHLENLAGGDSQIKLWVTCLGKWSEPAQGHSVKWTIDPVVRQEQFTDPAGVTGHVMSTPDCDPGEIAVAPGYYFLSGGNGRLVASRTTLAGDPSPLGRNWAMAFVFDAPTTYKRFYSCLRLTSNPAPDGHRHRIVVQRVGGSPVPNVTIPAGDTVERQVACGDLYKGMVHGFDVDPSDAPYEYFLGMDPRIKTRAYRFYNDGPADIKVWTGLTCFKDKTT
jgi:hypothetical protein